MAETESDSGVPNDATGAAERGVEQQQQMRAGDGAAAVDEEMGGKRGER